MEEKKDSLIDRENQQLKLLSSAEMDRTIFGAEEAVGEYTAENLFKSYPERYKAAGFFLSEGIGILRISKLLNMSPRPSPRHELDRMDSDGNYCPENCRWLPKFENRSRVNGHNHYIGNRELPALNCATP